MRFVLIVTALFLSISGQSSASEDVYRFDGYFATTPGSCQHPGDEVWGGAWYFCSQYGGYPIASEAIGCAQEGRAAVHYTCEVLVDLGSRPSDAESRGSGSVTICIYYQDNPLSGVDISGQATTSSDGCATFEANFGSHSLELSYPGYGSVSERVDHSRNGNTFNFYY